ncbi:MAG: tyrosine-type recombinase/integrase, partial [Chloroflexi bacterium]|nr:tyrosine-type recombinase/integrase [Chloroflexota bacterium]
SELIWARRDVPLVHLMLHTGLRGEEVTVLKVENVELRDRSGKMKVMGKGNKQRTIPLNAEARAALSAWIKMRPETDVVEVFVGRQGDKLGERAIQRVVSRIGKAAGVEDLTPHVLRHSFAKNLVNAGVGLETNVIKLTNGFVGNCEPLASNGLETRGLSACADRLNSSRHHFPQAGQNG